MSGHMALFEGIYCILMSEEESRQNPEQVAKAKEEAERKFGCPCGKWYLSYPALFTHVKQKHEGKVNFQLCSHLDSSSSPGLTRLADALAYRLTYIYIYLE